MISFKLVTLVGSLALLSTCLAQVPPLEDQHYFNGRLEADGDIPFADEMFKVSRTGPSNIGDTANFTCELPAEKSLISNKCFFVTPSNGTYYTVPSQTEEGQVFDDTDTPVPNLTALPSGDLNNICGISIQGLTENYFGKWSCILNDDQVPKHIGDFTMLTKEQLYVRDVRLPLHIVPDHYDVDLFPFIEVGNFTTSGSVQLKFQRVDDPAWLAKDPKLYTKIFLHAKDLAIQEDAITVTNEDGSKSYKIIGHEYGFERDFYIIHLEEELPKNAFFLLNIQFTSYLNDYLTGFYRSRYFDESIQDYKYLAVTQFESHSARLSFPCLDEPDKKATFKVSLTSEPEMTSLSNMPVENTLTTETGHKRTEFQKSVKMSTYLVAFMVSDFSFTQNTQDEAYKIWHQKSKDGQAVLSAENGEKILKFYEDFFDTPYPLPKTDMAAIPDFSAGAMENWGLITYRETLLLFVDGVSDADNRESIIKVMAHELAHQWFGNLVTMKWWTDLWLNEGFATYTQYHGMQHVFNESRARDRMVLYDVQNVFGADSLENSAALSQEVNNPNYDAEFGSIAYSKGCSILRMAENFLTLETFKKGVKKYLSNNRFDNAERDDLWSALTEAATEDNKLPPEISVKDIMDGWTLQAGYPVVKVEKSDGDFIKLSQKRFYINSNVSQESDTKWTIPINVAYPASASSGFDKTTPQEWMLKTGNKLSLEIENRPYVINVQETGFYRVNYDLENWNQLALVLKKDHTKIHEINRAQIIDDSLHLARAKQLSYETALGNTEYLDKEFEYIPWQSALRSFGFIDLMLNDNSSLTEFGYLKTYLTSKLEPLYKKLGFEVSPDDDHITTLTRKFVLSWLCKYDHEECVANSKALFKKWKDEGVNTISADLREVVYGTAIRNGGEEDWDFLWERFLDEKVDSEKQKLIFALGASANENSINKYLTATLTDSIRLQDVIYVYRGIGAFAPGRRFQFEWLQTHWTEIKDHFQARFDGYMVNLVSGYGAASNTEREINILQDFLDERTPDLGNSINDIKRIIETARINLNWMSSNQKTVADWLKSRVEGTTAAPATTTQSSKTTTPSSAAQLSNAFTLIVMLFFFIQHNL